MLHSSSVMTFLCRFSTSLFLTILNTFNINQCYSTCKYPGTVSASIHLCLIFSQSYLFKQILQQYFFHASVKNVFTTDHADAQNLFHIQCPPRPPLPPLPLPPLKPPPLLLSLPLKLPLCPPLPPLLSPPL